GTALGVKDRGDLRQSGVDSRAWVEWIPGAERLEHRAEAGRLLVGALGGHVRKNLLEPGHRLLHQPSDGLPNLRGRAVDAKLLRQLRYGHPGRPRPVHSLREE